MNKNTEQEPTVPDAARESFPRTSSKTIWSFAIFMIGVVGTFGIPAYIFIEVEGGEAVGFLLLGFALFFLFPYLFVALFGFYWSFKGYGESQTTFAKVTIACWGCWIGSVLLFFAYYSLVP